MIIALIVFPVIFILVLLCVGLGLAFHESQRKNHVRQLLWTAESKAPVRTVELVREAVTQSALAELLNGLPVIRKINVLIQQSLVEWSLSRFLFTSTVCASIGAFIGTKLSLFSSAPISGFLFGLLGLFGPYLYMARKRNKAIARFEEQFPEALDFLSRSMRAGHGFSISLELLAKDAPEPMSTVLRRVCHEMQLGAPMKVAMDKLLIQFPLIDVRFFVSAILLQQETGGNLSEILNQLSTVVRERFRLRGQVKALSAHGRITGLVLLFMPIAVVLILMVMSPAYLGALTSDKNGRWLLYFAAAGQVIAYFCIKKIVNIKV